MACPTRISSPIPVHQMQEQEFLSRSATNLRVRTEEFRLKWHPVLMTVVLIVAACFAACTGEEPGPVPETKSPALPGQPMVVVGDMTGPGTRGGTIDSVIFKIGLAPGVQSVDMEKISIIYADAVTDRDPCSGFGIPWQSSARLLGNHGGDRRGGDSQ